MDLSNRGLLAGVSLAALVAAAPRSANAASLTFVAVTTGAVTVTPGSNFSFLWIDDTVVDGDVTNSGTIGFPGGATSPLPSTVYAGVTIRNGSTINGDLVNTGAGRIFGTTAGITITESAVGDVINRGLISVVADGRNTSTFVAVGISESNTGAGPLGEAAILNTGTVSVFAGNEFLPGPYDEDIYVQATGFYQSLDASDESAVSLTVTNGNLLTVTANGNAQGYTTTGANAEARAGGIVQSGDASATTAALGDIENSGTVAVLAVADAATLSSGDDAFAFAYGIGLAQSLSGLGDAQVANLDGAVLSVDVSANADMAAYGLGNAYGAGIGVDQFIDGLGGAAITAGVENGGTIDVNVLASAEGSFKADLTAFGTGYGIRQELGGADDLAATVANTGILSVSFTAIANSQGGVVTGTSTAARAFGYVGGISQDLGGGSPATILGAVTNDGDISVVANVSAEGVFAVAGGVGTGTTFLLGAANVPPVGGYGVRQDAEGGDQTLRFTNNGTLSVSVATAAQGDTLGYAAGEAAGVIQLGDSSDTDEVVLTFTNSLGATLSVQGTASATGAVAYALMAATGISQEGEAGDATGTITNAGTMLVQATANVKGIAGTLELVGGYAGATGISQSINAALPTTAQGTIDNSGTLTVRATVNASGVGAYAGFTTPSGVFGYANATGVSQDVDGKGSVTAQFTNSGTIDVAAKADVVATAPDGAAYAYADVTGVTQSAGATTTPSATSINWLATASNTGTIKVRGEVNASSDFLAYAEVTGSEGFAQEAFGGGNGDATARLINEKLIDVGMLATASGAYGYAVAGTGSDGGSIIGVSQEAGNAGSVLAQLVNNGTIKVDSRAAGDFTDFGYAAAAAIGVYQSVSDADYGYVSNTSAAASLTNTGLIQVNARATINAGGSTVYSYATATGVKQFFNEGTVYRAGLSNSGKILVNARADGGGYAANVEAGGVTIGGEEATSVALNVINSNLIDVTGRATSTSDANATAIGVFAYAGRLTGEVQNRGTIRVRAFASGDATNGSVEASAIGFHTHMDVGTGAFTNSGVLSVYAQSNGSANAVGIDLSGYGGTDFVPTGADRFTINNVGGSIIAAESEDDGATIDRGDAILAEGAPNAVTINLKGGAGGDGYIFGDIDLHAGVNDVINVSDGETDFDGIIHVAGDKDGMFNILDGGTFHLMNNADLGPSRMAVNTFTVADGGTIAVTLTPDETIGTFPMVAAGTANLDGVINARFAPGIYADTQFYDNVIDADTRNGTFDAATSLSPLFEVTAIYDGSDNVDLDVMRVAFGEVPGLTDNQKSVGDAIEDVFDGLPPGPFADLVGGLFSLGPEEYAALLDQIGGAEHAQQLQLSLWSFDQLNGIIGERLRTLGTSGAGPAAFAETQPVTAAQAALDIQAMPVAAGPAGPSAWMRGFGTVADVAGDPNAQGFLAAQFGGYVGADFKPGPQWAFGLAGGYLNTGMLFDNGNFIRTQGFQAAAYGGWEGAANSYLQGVVGFGRFQNESTRNVTIGPVTGTASGEYASTVASFYGEGGHRFQRGAAMITPFASLGVVGAWNEAFTETGFNPSNLVVDAASGLSIRSGLGVRLTTERMVGDALVTPELRVAWQHEWYDQFQTIGAAFAGAPAGASFDIVGSQNARDVVVVGAGATVALGNGVNVMLDYQGRLGATISEHSLIGRVGRRF